MYTFINSLRNITEWPINTYNMFLKEFNVYYINVSKTLNDYLGNVQTNKSTATLYKYVGINNDE